MGNLAPFGLTNAEKLQIVNLTLIKPVELYINIVSTTTHIPPPPFPEFARSFAFFVFLVDRLENRMEEVLGVVRSSLTAPPPASSPTTVAPLPSTLNWRSPPGRLSRSSTRSQPRHTVT